MRKFNSKALFSTAVAFSLLSETSYAAKIFLKNEDSSEVHVVIEAGEGHQSMVHNNKPLIDTRLKPGEEKEVILSKRQTGNIEIFSVTGTVKMPSLYNKCFPLAMNTDYRVIFVGGSAGGTVCVLQPLKAH